MSSGSPQKNEQTKKDPYDEYLGPASAWPPSVETQSTIDDLQIHADKLMMNAHKKVKQLH